MKTIASRAGVSRMTVSRALRNDPSLRDATIRRIHVIAESLGYRPDPRIAELMSRLRRKRSARDHDSIAYVRIVGPARPLHTSDADRVGTGAASAAELAGYGFEPFVWRLGEMTPLRMANILHARGIRGAVLLNETEGALADLVDFPNRLACALVGPPIPNPQLHRAGVNRHLSVGLAIKQCAARGYQRVGLYLSARSDRNAEHVWLCSFLAHQQERELLTPELACVASEAGPKRFVQWLRAVHPDAIVSDSHEAIDWLNAPENHTAAADVGFVQLDWTPDCGPCAGVDQRMEEVGAIAIELVNRQLMHNEVGIPKYPLISLANGVWVEGGSLRPLPNDDGVQPQASFMALSY